MYVQRKTSWPAITSSTDSARIPSLARHSRLELTNSAIRLLNGTKAWQVIPNGLGLIWELPRLEQRRVLGWQKHSKKIPCITAAIAEELFPRMNHAILSSLTARRGEDGHRVFSFPAIVAPYAGSMTAIYGWYPNRFGAKDAFRIGNYSLLAYVGENISLEFFYSGPHSLLSRLHLNNAHASPLEGPNK